MVEAGGVGTFKLIENTQVIDFSRRTKRCRIRNCAQLERIWNTDSRSLLANFSNGAGRWDSVIAFYIFDSSYNSVAFRGLTTLRHRPEKMLAHFRQTLSLGT
jgi:hypothetical protein